MRACEKPIGIFDSGIGGLSVLRWAKQQLPHENFIYYADRLHAPYGGKDRDEILALTMDVAAFLMQKDIKAMVVACNTATSASVDVLRATYDQPIVCMEPAIRPAFKHLQTAQVSQDAKVLVMATQAMLSNPRMHERLVEVGDEDRCILLPCPGLVELIERGDFGATAIRDYLQRRLQPYAKEHVDTVVLGCTHYVLIEPLVRACCQNILHCDTVIHGNGGTARQLERVLQQGDLLNPSLEPGWIEIHASAMEQDTIEIAQRVLACDICAQAV